VPVDGFRGSICPTFFRKCQMWVRWATGAKWMPYNCATSIMGAGRCQLSGACQSERAVGTRSSQSRASGCRSRGDGPAYESAMSLHWQSVADARPQRRADRRESPSALRLLRRARERPISVWRRQRQQLPT
jgi:hypothetical protein